MILVVTTEGMIEEIKEMEVEEVEAPEVVEEEAPVEAEAADRQPKRTIESVVKEHHFSSEIETLKAELSKLKEEKEALAKELDTQKVELSTPAVEPISYNPENETKVEVFRYSSKRNQSSIDRVLGKLY
jgi:predicted RNase H-like nuclease (RuvC/YqgF family)